MRTPLAALALLLLYAAHNDLWLWYDPSRIGPLPVGLAYHVGFCLVTALVLYLIVRYAPPAALRDDRRPGDGERR